jgi:hypothetical protein
LKAGIVYTTPPEPVDRDETTMFHAGVVSFGLEYRQITEASLRETFAKMGALDDFEREVQPGFAGAGVSIHVFGGDGHEYLRFDCFDDDPHYHYNHPPGPDGTPHNHWVPFDDVADGDILTWTLKRLRTRLRAMLVEAEGAHIASQIEDTDIAKAIDELETTAMRLTSARD